MILESFLSAFISALSLWSSANINFLTTSSTFLSLSSAISLAAATCLSSWSIFSPVVSN